VSPWRQGNVDFERTSNDVTIPAPPPPVLTDRTERQISPHIAATLLTIPRPDLTAGNAQIVDALKVGCPGYAVMRSLMMGFRALLKQSAPTTTTRTPPRCRRSRNMERYDPLLIHWKGRMLHSRCFPEHCRTPPGNSPRP
jgi:hypothetical protein